MTLCLQRQEVVRRPENPGGSLAPSRRSPPQGVGKMEFSHQGQGGRSSTLPLWLGEAPGAGRGRRAAAPPTLAPALLLSPASQGSRLLLSPAPATSTRPGQVPTELLLAARRHRSFEAPPLPAGPRLKSRPLGSAPSLAAPGSVLPEARALGPRAFCVVLGPSRALSPQSRLLG